MIWMTWRQHRAEAAVGGAVLVALAVALVAVGRLARDRAQALGLPGCGPKGDCSTALDALHRDFHSIPPFTGALLALPLLAGMFWAAPLVAREYEAGTHRLAWTQSVSPVRWLATKLGLILATVALGALALGALVTWSLDPLTPAFGGRYNSSWYDIQGVVPVACMLFALAVGVAASAWIGRTIPAMAVTLVVYAAARIPIHWIRPHLWGTRTMTSSTPFSALLANPDSDPTHTFRAPAPLGSLVLNTSLLDPAGRAFPSGVANRDLLLRFCPTLPPRGDISRDAAASCLPKLTGSVRAVVRYQPPSHFWYLQAAESVAFLAAAALLVALTVFGLVRRRPV